MIQPLIIGHWYSVAMINVLLRMSRSAVTPAILNSRYSWIALPTAMPVERRLNMGLDFYDALCYTPIITHCVIIGRVRGHIKREVL
jgi:hypothetical protein